MAVSARQCVDTTTSRPCTVWRRRCLQTAFSSGASGAATAVLLPADVLMLDSTTIHKVAVATGMTCERRSWTRQLDVSVFFLPHGLQQPPGRRTSSPSTDGVATLLQQGHGNLLSGHQAGCTS